MNKLKKIITFLLTLPVKILLARKKPTVIGITGSVGKTSCKEFLGKLLSGKYTVLVSSDGYNTEIGAPLALFGEKVPDKLSSVIGWSALIIRVYWKAFFVQDFPEKVVIEMGTDTYGEIRYLAKLFRPSIAVVLEVLPVHLQDFKNVEEIAAEKSELVKAVPAEGSVYLNYDNELIRNMSSVAKGRVIYFGKDVEGEGYKAANIRTDIGGLEFSVINQDKRYKFEASLFGKHTVYSLLAAIAVAHGEGLSFSLIRTAVAKLKPFKGRMNIIEGISGSTIIDDSYNANPGSVIAALDFLSEQKGRKIALLGNMNELGDFEKEGHLQVGARVATAADFLITVGDKAGKYIVDGAIKAGFDKKNIAEYMDSSEAGIFVRDFVKKGDIVLVKGSQNKVRLEKAIEKFMKNPSRKQDVLVRQSEFWDTRS